MSSAGDPAQAPEAASVAAPPAPPRPARGEIPTSLAGMDILTKLSSGGMGDILLARKRSVHGFEKLLAIKTIRGDLARRPDIRAMFHDEARLVARLDHRAIAQVYDYGEEDGTLYLAMEYVPGIALNKLLGKRAGPLPPVVAMRMIAEVCRGLHAAHELSDNEGALLGVVHRDVSPGNLILTFDGHMKILDFGIAWMKGRESPDTVVGELKGKPSYMAPEHLRAEKVDRRADIYSVSVVLHELLTGRKLFTRDTVMQTVMAVETLPVSPPSESAGPLPAGLDEIVLKGLSRRTQDRFADAKAMASALDALVAQVGGPSLEAFVDADLRREKEEHKAWLSGVLNPRDDRRRPSSDQAAPLSSPEAPGEDTSRARPPRSTSSSAAASPLVESTTLVPPEVSDAQAEVRGPSRRAKLWMGGAAALAVLLGVGLLLARERPAEVAPLPPEAQHAAPPAEPAPPTPPVAVPAAEPPAQAEPPPPPVPEVRVEHRPDPPRREERRRREPRREAPPPARQEEPERAGFGFVTIGAQPYALVRIDGQEVGVTPVMRKKIAAGRHEIQLLSPDTGEPRLKRTIEVSADEHVRLTIP